MTEPTPPAPLRDRCLSPHAVNKLLSLPHGRLAAISNALGSPLVPVSRYGNRAEPWNEYAVRVICTALEA